jgi:hypothetical protein
MISRSTWADAARSQEWLAHSASIMTYIVLRLRQQPAEPPSNFSWLKVFDLD